MGRDLRGAFWRLRPRSTTILSRSSRSRESSLYQRPPRQRQAPRFRAWRAARMIMRSLAQDHDVVLVHDPSCAGGCRASSEESDLGRPRGSRGRASGQVLDAGASATAGGRGVALGRTGGGTTALPVVGGACLSAEVPPTASCGGQFCIGSEVQSRRPAMNVSAIWAQSRCLVAATP